MEMNQLQSMEERECMFFAIPFTSDKRETHEDMAQTLKDIIREQEKGIKEHDNSAIFDYQNVKLKKGEVKMRITNYKDYTEVASFLIADYCIFFVFGVTKSDRISRMIEYVNFVLDEMIIVILNGVDSKNSHSVWNSFLRSYLQNDNINVAIYR